MLVWSFFFHRFPLFNSGIFPSYHLSSPCLPAMMPFSASLLLLRVRAKKTGGFGSSSIPLWPPLLFIVSVCRDSLSLLCCQLCGRTWKEEEFPFFLPRSTPPFMTPLIRSFDRAPLPSPPLETLIARPALFLCCLLDAVEFVGTESPEENKKGAA